MDITINIHAELFELDSIWESEYTGTRYLIKQKFVSQNIFVSHSNFRRFCPMFEKWSFQLIRTKYTVRYSGNRSYTRKRHVMFRISGIWRIQLKLNKKRYILLYIWYWNTASWQYLGSMFNSYTFIVNFQN